MSRNTILLASPRQSRLSGGVDELRHASGELVHASPQAGAIGYALFLVLNAVLFLRPAELIPELEGVQLYEIVILSCMAFSWKPLLQELQGRSLVRQPVTVCVLGLWVATALSHLSHANLGGAWTAARDFGKVVIYYLLLVSLVSNPRRLRLFLYALVVYV